MPDVVANRLKWTEHKWEREGHEWSPGGTRAGTEQLWWRSINPRVQAALPTATLLEIAPGFGRWTSYLLDRCERLIAVDITERCVEVCRERFADAPHAEFWVNDGETLPMVSPSSIDFAFSFDSLVHVEAAQIRAYLRELVRRLKPGATGFFHHSNLGAYAGASGEIAPYVTKRHWRAATMSARLFREACREAGLVCVSQEVINWIGRGARADRHRLPGERIPLTDCFSTFVRPPDPREHRPTQVYVNRHFVEEWRELLVLANLYGSTAPDARPDRAPEPARGGVMRTWRAGGLAGTAAAVRARVAGALEPWRSRAAEEANARRYVGREPILRAIARRECPDCSRALARRGTAAFCEPCNVTFVVS